jgi:hypothetical protein
MSNTDYRGQNPSAIMASLDDVNAELPDGLGPDAAVIATEENTALVQISVARVIRAYLSGALDQTTLYGWDSPDNTPDTIRVIAAKLIAAQVYFNQSAKTSLNIDTDSFAQKRYDEAKAMLDAIVAGTMIIPDIPSESAESVSDLDFFPVDDTDRAFTMGMQF